VTVYRKLIAPVGAVGLLACGTIPAALPSPTDTLRLVTVATGLASPLYVAAPPGDTARLFIVEQPGRIRILQHGQLLPTPFLDVSAKVTFTGDERGLLSVAFHPNYATNHYVYVDYVDLNNNTRIERYSASAADSNVADTGSHKLILAITQPPYPNHKGGHVQFGPDGMLYIGMGDGGAGGDPGNRAQNPDSLLGKLLRIDVNTGDTTPYKIPPTNPYAAGGGRGEIWAVGLRNPWRFAFDRTSGLLYIADVGQDLWEEVDVQPASQGGVNYGWRIMEGAHCYTPNPCDALQASLHLVLPAIEYDHSGGNCTVIGGFVYRGTRFPTLTGEYFYTDLCSAWVESFSYGRLGVVSQTRWTLDTPLSSPHSFGQDANGELYVISGGGTIYRIGH
jgi:glucose/arabinose dehydrogenase